MHFTITNSSVSVTGLPGWCLVLTKISLLLPPLCSPPYYHPPYCNVILSTPKVNTVPPWKCKFKHVYVPGTAGRQMTLLSYAARAEAKRSGTGLAGACASPSLQSTGISMEKGRGLAVCPLGTASLALLMSFPPGRGDTRKVKTVPNGKKVRGPERVLYAYYQTEPCMDLSWLLNHRLETYGPHTTKGPLPTFVNKVLLEASHTHSFTFYLQLLSHCNGRMNHCDRMVYNV